MKYPVEHLIKAILGDFVTKPNVRLKKAQRSGFIQTLEYLAEASNRETLSESGPEIAS